MRPPGFRVRTPIIAVALALYEVWAAIPIASWCLSSEPDDQDPGLMILAVIYPPLCLAIWSILRAWFRAE